MHTAVSELMMAFEKMLEYGCRYCCVCLRMENEKNLIKPNAFKAYIATLSNKNLDFTEMTRVCTICEEKAKAALRFLKAAHLAVSIQELYSDMLKNKSYRREVQQHFNKINMREHFKALDEVEEQLMSWRAHTEFVFTEVLTVENNDMSVDSDSSENIFYSPHSVSTGHENNGLKLKEKNVPEITMETECSQLAEDDTVIILDDDEVIEVDALKNENDNTSDNTHHLTKLMKSQGLRKRGRFRKSKSKMKIRNEMNNDVIKPDNTQTAGGNFPSKNLGNTVIIPMGTANKLESSIDGGNNSQDQPVENPKLVKMLNWENNQTDLQAVTNFVKITNINQTVPNIFIQPAICSTTGSLIFPDISPGEENMASFRAANVVILPKNIANTSNTKNSWPIRVTSGDAKEIGKNPIQIEDSEVVRIYKRNISGPLKGTNECPKPQNRFEGPDEGLVKEPVPKQGKIDWEDKIPMDVISFMESHKEQTAGNEILSGTSVGGITDVRSITEMMQDSEVPTIVDLCYLD